MVKRISDKAMVINDFYKDSQEFFKFLDKAIKHRFKFVDKIEMDIEHRTYMGAYSLNFRVKFNTVLDNQDMIGFNKVLTETMLEQSDDNMLMWLFNTVETALVFHLVDYNSIYEVMVNYDSLNRKLPVNGKNENSNLQSKKKLKI